MSRASSESTGPPFGAALAFLRTGFAAIGYLVRASCSAFLAMTLNAAFNASPSAAR